MGKKNDFRVAIRAGEPNRAELILAQILLEIRNGKRKMTADALDDLLSELFKLRIKKKDRAGAEWVISQTGDPISRKAREEKLAKKLE